MNVIVSGSAIDTSEEHPQKCSFVDGVHRFWDHNRYQWTPLRNCMHVKESDRVWGSECYQSRTTIEVIAQDLW